MSWQVALLLDDETDVNVAVGQMPLWAQGTDRRRAYPLEWRRSWDAMWYPDPGYTLLNTSAGDDLVARAVSLLPTIEEHHPNLFCVHLFGVDKSGRLEKGMREAGYIPAPMDREGGITFVRSLEQFAKELVLDASSWSLRSEWFWAQDFYSAFFQAVGAPEWHGRNLDALNDSIAGGGINRIEVPYRIVLCNVPRENKMVQGVLDDFVKLIRHLHAKGCPVSIILAD